MANRLMAHVVYATLRDAHFQEPSDTQTPQAPIVGIEAKVNGAEVWHPTDYVGKARATGLTAEPTLLNDVLGFLSSVAVAVGVFVDDHFSCE